MKKRLEEIKEENPDMDQTAAFQIAASDWEMTKKAAKPRGKKDSNRFVAFAFAQLWVRLVAAAPHCSTPLPPKNHLSQRTDGIQPVYEAAPGRAQGGEP